MARSRSRLRTHGLGVGWKRHAGCTDVRGARTAPRIAGGRVVTGLYPSRVKGFACVAGAVLVVIGLGVGISAATGNGGLSLALTCAPATGHEYGPPGARFTASFPGPVSLLVPAGVVDRAPDYELCGYSAGIPKGSALTFASIDVRAEPVRIQLSRPLKTNRITRFTTGDARGVYLLRCYVGGGGCSGAMVVQNGHFQWFATGDGISTQVIRAFFRSLHVVA